MNERTQEVIEAPPAESRGMVTVGSSPAAMMQAALATGMNAADIRDLLAVQREWEENEARKAFNLAFAQFKAEAVRVYKGTEIKDGPLKGKRHANLFDVVVASSEPLARHGLSTSWKLTKDEPALIEVTCVLKHSAGHSESVSMSAAPDTGPGRNAIQARGSALKYLERYTLMAILGLEATDREDDDGRGSGLTEEQAEAKRQAEAVIADFRDAIANATTLEELQAIKPEIAALADKRDLVAIYNARQRDLKQPRAA